ncbi:MAG: hypothetical protein K0U84_05105 [Actinomycetia bacterium]|nr:hypothetical protein [Actinomycetes bacterium]
MSRTDAHAPYAVRVVRREIAVLADHDCAGQECDLPALEPGWADTRTRCRWEFAYTGTSICSCWMCHWPSKPRPRRSGRAAQRIALRAVARHWNGGDADTAFSV